MAGRTTVLYDGNSNKLPNQTGAAINAPWLTFQNPTILPQFGGTAITTVTGSGTSFITDNQAYAGFTNYDIDFTNPTKPIFKTTPLNSAFPVLDRNAGYTLSFTAQIASETPRELAADKDKDGIDDRSGFSIIITGNDKKGIELSFWQNRIWAKEDSLNQKNLSNEPDFPIFNPYLTFFTHAEGVVYDTTAMVNYNVAVLGNSYTLFANNTAILSGRLRDYSPFKPLTYNGISLPNPYNNQNFIFLGDNTFQAGATVNLNRIAVATGKISDILINESQPSAAIPFTISDFETDINSLTVTTSSSNTNLVANSNIIINGTGENRTITVTPTANQTGNATVTLNISDGVDTTVQTFEVKVFPVAEVININSNKTDGNYKAGDIIPITITFDEIVNVTGTPQLTLETGTVDAIVNYSSGSGTDTLIFDYTIAAGEMSLNLDYISTTAISLNGGTIKNLAGKDAILTLPVPGENGSLSTNKNITIDTTAPRVTLTSISTNNVNSSFNVTATFTEKVTGFSDSDITLTNGKISNFTNIDAETYSFDIIPIMDGTVSIDIAANVVEDIALNGNVAATQLTRNANLTIPNITSITPNLVTIADSEVGNSNFTLTLVYSEVMDTNVNPTISFPSENPNNTIAFVTGNWTNNTTYVAIYNVANVNEAITNIDISVTGGADINGNIQLQTDIVDIFNINTIPVVSITAITDIAMEDGNNGIYRIQRTSTNLSGDLTVNLTIDSSSTVEANEYTLNNGNLSVIIPDGIEFIDIELVAIDDIQAEGIEGLRLNLTSGDGYTIDTTNNHARVIIAANDFVVTNTNDSGEGSLRQAIINANNNPGADIITFAGDIFSDEIADIITLTSRQLAVTEELKIQGTDASKLTIRGNSDSVNGFRVINATAPLTIDGITISGGNAVDSNGGGIRSSSELTLSNTVISGNQATNAGGGILFRGTELKITNSIIADNYSGREGGGIHQEFTGNIIIDRTTISGNIAVDDGGGINNEEGTLLIFDSTIAYNTGLKGGGIQNEEGGSVLVINSTISGNNALENGGGINNTGNTGGLIIENTTITNNSADIDGDGNGDGGGIYTDANTTMKGTIIAGNFDKSTTNSVHPDVSGIFSDSGYNLIGNNQGSSGFNSSTLIGTEINVINAGLEELKNNGGATATHALLDNSLAINAGDASEIGIIISEDQRGFNRVQGGIIDIGAFESNFETVQITVLDSDVSESATDKGIFRVSRLGRDGNLTVNFSVDSSSSATSGEYTLSDTSNASVIIADGQSYVDIILTPSDDTLPEADETVKLNLVMGAGYIIDNSANHGSITIAGNDAITYNLSPATISVNELDTNPQTLTFTITRDGGVGVESSVEYLIAGTAMNVSDYNNIQIAGVVGELSGAINFAPGETSKTITIDLLGDTRYELDETITVTLSNPNKTTAPENSTIQNGNALVDIINNDSQPNILISNITIAEGDSGVSNAILTVNLDAAAGVFVSVDYSTVNNTAIAGVDYNSVAGTITFNPNTTSQDITIPIIGNFVDELDESFFVNFTNASNGNITNSQIQATITDNDTAGLTITPITGLTTTEAGGTATFRIQLNSQPTADVSLGLSSSNTSEGTLSTANISFNSTNWNSPQTITVIPVDDRQIDGNIIYRIITDAVVSQDGKYNGINPVDIEINNLDNDIPVNLINGSDISEVLTGTEQSDSIFSFGGNDVISGGFGHDLIDTGDGNDTVYGDLNIVVTSLVMNMNDTIYGGKGTDKLYGGVGDDLLYGGDDSDQIWGDEGNDKLWGGAGNDLLIGGMGNDLFIVARQEGVDTIRDFQIGQDLIGLSGSMTYSAITITQRINNTFITDNSNNQVLAILTGVSSSSLTINSFIQI